MVCVVGGGRELFKHKVSFLFSGLYFSNSVEVISFFKKLVSPGDSGSSPPNNKTAGCCEERERSDSERDFRIETCHSKVPENGKMDRSL